VIGVYFWPAGNGKKITIMLEECGLPVIPVNINRGDQLTPEYEAINPNNRMPASIDRDAQPAPITVFESGASLQHLAERCNWPRRVASSCPPTRLASTGCWSGSTGRSGAWGRWLDGRITSCAMRP
jgi:glutathione S-transferase